MLLLGTTLQVICGNLSLGAFLNLGSHDHPAPLRWQEEQGVPEPETDDEEGPPVRKGCGYEGSRRQHRGKCQGLPGTKPLTHSSGVALWDGVCPGTHQVRY